MAEQTRVLAYEGLYRSQAEELFLADALEAALHGWHPTEQQWLGITLVVTYAHRKRSRWPRSAGGAESGRSLPSVGRLIAWVGALLMVIPTLTFVSVAMLNLIQHGSIVAP